MTRAEVLQQIITIGEYREKAFQELVNFQFDNDIELFEVSNDILVDVLRKYISNLLSGDELEEWANFIECRDDINYEKVEGYIYALANPEVMGEISRESINKMLQLLSA